MLNNGGIALLPSWVVGKDIQRGDATVVLPEYHAKPQHVDRAVYAVYPYTRNVSAKVRAYIDFIAESSRRSRIFEWMTGTTHPNENWVPVDPNSPVVSGAWRADESVAAAKVQRS